MTGLTVDDHGQVVAGTMLSGSTADRKWHPEWLKQWEDDVPENFWRGSCYVSDAAVVTSAALTRLADMPMDWLGRLPASYRLAKQLKEQAWADGGDWTDHEALSPKRRVARYEAKHLMWCCMTSPLAPLCITQTRWTTKKNRPCNGKFSKSPTPWRRN